MLMVRLGSWPLLLLLKPQASDAYSCTAARRACGIGGSTRRFALLRAGG
jgi:hypothetical protein